MTDVDRDPALPIVRLDPADIDAIARRVAELAGADLHPAAGRYVDAAGLARILGVDRDWVYTHAAELGAIRLGGPHGRLRFDPQRIPRDLEDKRRSRVHKQVPRTRSHRSRAGDLIPYEPDPSIHTASFRRRPSARPTTPHGNNREHQMPTDHKRPFSEGGV